MLKFRVVVSVVVLLHSITAPVSAQKKCMYIGADPDAGGNISENAKYDAYMIPLIKEWGYTIDKMHECQDLPKYTDDDYTKYDFIFLSETVHSKQMDPLKKVRIPMVCTDGWAAKKTSLAFNDSDNGVGIYEPTRPVIILESAKDHILAAGFNPGEPIDLGVERGKTGCLLVWGQPTIPVVPIAGVQGNLTQLAVYGIEKGTKNADGVIINHRVAVIGAHAWCWPNDMIKEPLKKFYQAGIKWVLDDGVSVKSPANNAASHATLSLGNLNSSRNVTFSLSKQSQVKLTVLNNLGQKVQTLVNSVQKAGNHTVNVNSTTMNSGMYLFKLETENSTTLERVLFTK